MPVGRAGKHSPVVRYQSPTSSLDVSYFSFFPAVSASLVNHILLTKLASLLWGNDKAGDAPDGRPQ